MTAQNSGQRAAGYVYAYESATDTQALLFGRCGTNRSTIMYRVTRNEGRASSQQFDLLMQGDFSALLESDLIGDVGQLPVTLRGEVNAQPFSVHFEPDSTTSGNALFRTSTGLQGAVIKTQSSTWEVVVVIAILAAAAVTLVAMAENTSLTVEATVDTPAGGGSVNINVNGRPPGGGE
jgi:hypothetical protein